ncbi:uncharacterized protein LOC128234752 [Mya arenaria]|uniref:uncharacterized protein LOC128234752 n=1 Tax=Mya arenaria TaxID=6604 RepID=UPI0022E94EAF|nr:uncharacterized protein LOC128234752 [Mya arenaria]
METLVDMTSVNSWKTLANLSSTLGVRFADTLAQGTECDLENKCEKTAFEINLNTITHNGRKLVGILKKSGDSKEIGGDIDISFKNQHHNGLEGSFPAKCYRRLDHVDEEADEGLGDLDDVFEDFEEVYEAFVGSEWRESREGGECSLVGAREALGWCQCPMRVQQVRTYIHGDTGLREHHGCSMTSDLGSPISPVDSADYPDSFKYHCDSLSLSRQTHKHSDSLSVLQTFMNSDTNENIVPYSRPWKTNFLQSRENNACIDISENDKTYSDMVDLKASVEDSSAPLTPSKSKSVHFAIFPKIVEIPRISDLEKSNGKDVIVQSDETNSREQIGDNISVSGKGDNLC